jgi:hypothetical protein
MENDDLNGHLERTVAGERIPHERPVLTVGREDVPDEVDVIVTKEETVQRWFVYEEPGKSSLIKSVSLRPIGDNGEYVTLKLELRDPDAYGQDCPYLWAESIRVPRRVFEEFLLWSARHGGAGEQGE